MSPTDTLPLLAATHVTFHKLFLVVNLYTSLFHEIHVLIAMHSGFFPYSSLNSYSSHLLTPFLSQQLLISPVYFAFVLVATYLTYLHYSITSQVMFTQYFPFNVP